MMDIDRAVPNGRKGGRYGSTRMIYDALNDVHQRVHEEGPEAAARASAVGL